MNAFTASRGEVRAVSDAEILDAYSLLGAREGVFCEPASAASVAGLLKHGAEGRVVCVLTGHGLKDPQTALNRAPSVVPCEPDLDERGIARGVACIRARDAARRSASGACRPPPRPTSGRATTCSPRRCLRRSSSRSRRPASSSSTRDVPGVPDRPLEPVRARLRAAAPGGRAHVPDPLRDPGCGGARLERRRDRRRARRRRPPVRARRSAVRAGPRARGPSRTTWRRRCSAASSSALTAGRCASSRRPASRAWWRSRPSRCLPRRRGPRCPRRRR